MVKGSFTKRFVRPAAEVLIVMAVSFIVYNISWRIENRFLHDGLAYVFGVIYFSSLAFGTLYVYRQAFFRGAGPAERILCSLINPFIWSTKEVVVLTGIYTLGESLYFYLNPVNVLLYSGVLAQIGLSEILCRRKMKRSGQPVRVVTVPAAAALILGLSSVVLMFAWELGVHHFYIFQEGYKALFGYGVSLASLGSASLGSGLAFCS